MTAIDALEVGMASRTLGAGRQTKDDAVDLSVGILLQKKIGDRVDQGEALAVFYADGDEDKISVAKKRFLDAYTIGPNRVDPPKLLMARVTGEGIQELP